MMTEDKYMDLEKKIYNDLMTITKDDHELTDLCEAEDESPLDSLDSQERIILMVECLKEKDPTSINKRTLEYLFKILEKDNEYFTRILWLFKELRNEVTNEITKNYLERNENINKVLLNVAILNENTKICKNKEISDFLEMNTNFPNYNFIKSYIHFLEKPSLEILLPKLLKKEKNIYFYKTFSEINIKVQSKHMELMDEEIEQDEDFVNFIYSLMVDEQSMTYGFEKLYRFDYFNSLFSAIKSLVKLNRLEERFILPEDENFMELLLKVVLKLTNKILIKNNNKISTTVISLAESFFDILTLKISLPIKTLIYKILTNLGTEEEISRKVAEFLMSDYIQKVAYLDFEQEKVENTFDCTSSLLNLSLDYKFKKIKEFCFHVLTSESPKIIKPVLKIFEIEKYKIENGLFFKHLKEACIKDSSVIDILIKYCLSLNFVIPSVDLTKVIMSKESKNFFKYVSLFTDFSVYLSNDFLKRVSENKKEGLISLLKMKNISDFIIKNKNYFNLLIKMEKNSEILKLITEVYEKIVSLSSVYEFSFSDDKKILLPEIYTSALFRIFSKCLIYYHCNNKIQKKDYILKEVNVADEDVKQYCNYLKAQIVLGYDININEVIRKYPGKYVDDLVGYYRSFGYKVEFDSLTLKSKVLEEKKDNDLFIKNYESSDKFIKFILFKIININELNKNIHQKKEFERILKNQIINLKVEGINNQDNLLLFRNALNLLLILDNIDPIIKIIDEIKALPESLNELYVKISLRNLCNGGTKFLKKAIQNGSLDLQVKFLLMLYLKDLWNNEFSYWFMEIKNKTHNNADVEYLIRNIN